MQPGVVIFDATAACQKSFTKCQKFPKVMKERWAENRLADFNLWASGLGASARGRASLDSRLALRQDARDIIVNLLHLLNSLIENCMELAQLDPLEDQAVVTGTGHESPKIIASPPTLDDGSFSPWEDDSSSDSRSVAADDTVSNSTLSKAMKDVDGVLDQLARISVVIRQSGTRSRLEKADRTFDPESNQDLKDLKSHLTSVILSGATSDLSLVQSQLIECNLRRRNRFLYAQHHSKGLEMASSTTFGTKETLETQSTPNLPEPVIHSQQITEANTPTLSKPDPVTNMPCKYLYSLSIKTGTSASGVTGLPKLPQNPIPSQLAPTQMSTTVIKLDYPGPPQIDNGLVFRCPCCCQTLPAMMADRNRWKKHLAQDIFPYSCIIPNCPKFKVLYITKEDWKTHLLKDHQTTTTWVCFACVDTVQFDEEDAFVSHTLKEHHDAISEEDISTLQSACMRLTPVEISSCPLCSWPGPTDVDVDREALLDHIAEDIHTFSLRSLPWGPENANDKRDQVYLAAAKVGNWLEDPLVANPENPPAWDENWCEDPLVTNTKNPAAGDEGWWENSLAAITEDSPLAEGAQESPLPHYFDLNKYFEERGEISDESEIDSNNTIKLGLAMLREENTSLLNNLDGINDLDAFCSVDPPGSPVIGDFSQFSSWSQEKYLDGLFVINPKSRKISIQQRNGGLLDVHRWILSSDQYGRLISDNEDRLLWISGDPGTGKTMLLCSIVEELITDSTQPLSYFFCEAAEKYEHKSALAVLRSLLWLLCDKDSNLIKYVRREYEKKGRLLFEDISAIEKTLHDMFDGEDLLNSDDMFFEEDQPPLKNAIFVIDALDECPESLELIDIIIRLSNASYGKWIISSPSWPSIRDQLRDAKKMMHISLELTQQPISNALGDFIQHNVQRLSWLNEREVVDTLSAKANNPTFLWVTLVCAELEHSRTEIHDTHHALKNIPKSLDGVYRYLLEKISAHDKGDICLKIIATVCIASRPLMRDELYFLIKQSTGLSLKEICDLAVKCAPILTIEGGVVCIVHQSACDFLMKEWVKYFPSSISEQHHIMCQESLLALRILRRNIYNLSSEGALIDEISQPDPSPLAGLEYPCLHWVDHFEQIGDKREFEYGNILRFVETKILSWLEALSLMKRIPEGVKVVSKLKGIVISMDLQNALTIRQRDKGDNYLSNLIEDVQRFVFTFRQMLETAPLQVYNSALLFSPTNSHIKKLFMAEKPRWTLKLSTPNTGIQTLEGHNKKVTSVAFSPDGQQFVSGSEDHTVRIWDISPSSECVQTLSFGSTVHAVAFSADGKRLAVGLDHGGIELWDVSQGSVQQEIYCGFEGVMGVAFSPNGELLASLSNYGSIQMWNLTTERCIWKCDRGGSRPSISFSVDSQQLTAARLNDVEVWGVRDGTLIYELEGHQDRVQSVNFSTTEHRLLASASYDGTIKLWDTATSTCVQTLDHGGKVTSIVFSDDDFYLISASLDGTIKMWNKEWACIQALDGFSNSLSSFAVSPVNKLLVSVSDNNAIKFWDLAVLTNTQLIKDHSDYIRKVTFSAHAQWLASASHDGTIKIWDASSYFCIQELQDSSHHINQIAFSPNDQWLVVLYGDHTVKIWDTTHWSCIETFRNLLPNSFPDISSDDQYIALFLEESVVVWSLATRTQVQKFHINSSIVSFSYDGEYLAIATPDGIHIMNIMSGHRANTLKLGSLKFIWRISLSEDSRWLAAITDVDIVMWDVNTGNIDRNLSVGYTGASPFCSFSGINFAFGNSDELKIWNIETDKQILRMRWHNEALESIRFDPKDESCLYTNLGAIQLHDTVDGTVEKVSFHGYGLTNDGAWVVRGCDRILWLPPEWRTSNKEGSTVIMGSNIGIVNRDGRLLMMIHE